MHALCLHVLLAMFNQNVRVRPILRFDVGPWLLAVLSVLCTKSEFVLYCDDMHETYSCHKVCVS